MFNFDKKTSAHKKIKEKFEVGPIFLTIFVELKFCERWNEPRLRLVGPRKK